MKLKFALGITLERWTWLMMSHWLTIPSSKIGFWSANDTLFKWQRWWHHLLSLFFKTDQINQFGFANYKQFFYESKTTLSQLFHETKINLIFQNTIIKFLKLTKLQQKQQPKRVLIRLLPSLFIELGWYLTTYVKLIKQLCFL